ncbi:ribonuclease H2 subunit B-like [Tubulanus polymorphus]|uniref:ribonuclease H2 subunit B-like n=1 Tax=Tubulanus polymorphus TaxID=672921 RepID=UPI003DA23C99
MAEELGRVKQNQCILILPETSLSAQDTENGQNFYQIRHPKTGESCLFMISNGGTRLHEVIKFDESYRSWFIGNHVQQDGGLYLVTPMDPIFLLLPYLQKSLKDNRSVPLEDILTDSTYSDLYRIKNCLGMEQLDLIADTRGVDDDLMAYRYNQEKTLTWLKTKVRRLADNLKKRRFIIDSGQSDVFIKSMKQNESNIEEYLLYSHGIISDYLPDDLSQKLKDYMGLKDPEIECPTPVKLQEESNEEPPLKKLKMEKENGPKEDYSQQLPKDAKKTNMKQSRAQKKLNQVDTKGMKSLTNFFSPKSK